MIKGGTTTGDMTKATGGTRKTGSDTPHIQRKYLLWRSQVNFIGIVDDKEVAGKLFSFVYHVMYGAVAASDVVAERNSFSSRRNYGAPFTYRTV